MTTDELRDRLARALGWQQLGAAWLKEEPAPPGRKCGRIIPPPDHPFPPNDLNALASVWREELKGWRIQLKQETQSACPGVSWWRGNAFHSVHGFAVPANDPGLGTLAMYAETEYELRLALTLACVEAERGKK